MNTIPSDITVLHSVEYPPLEQVMRPAITTAEAAYYLNRQPQTLRAWACLEPIGAIRPLRVMGRLAWPVSEIRAMLEGAK